MGSFSRNENLCDTGVSGKHSVLLTCTSITLQAAVAVLRFCCHDRKAMGLNVWSGGDVCEPDNYEAHTTLVGFRNRRNEAHAARNMTK
jgi:hypothetical protein